jgi:hypothetical protein
MYCAPLANTTPAPAAQRLLTRGPILSPRSGRPRDACSRPQEADGRNSTQVCDGRNKKEARRRRRRRCTGDAASVQAVTPIAPFQTDCGPQQVAHLWQGLAGLWAPLGLSVQMALVGRGLTGEGRTGWRSLALNCRRHFQASGGAASACAGCPLPVY